MRMRTHPRRNIIPPSISISSINTLKQLLTGCEPGRIVEMQNQRPTEREITGEFRRSKIAVANFLKDRNGYGKKISKGWHKKILGELSRIICWGVRHDINRSSNQIKARTDEEIRTIRQQIREWL